GEGVVGGVADQDVAEAEGVLAGERGRLGSHELLADEPRESRDHLRLLRRQGLNGAAMEDLALDGPPLENDSLGRFELVEPGRQQRLHGRWYGNVAVAALLDHGEHLLDEERI